MEGLLHIETGPKKGLFSLKAKKKFHVVLSGITMAYTRDGESTPTGTIVFTTDTIVEGSPKGKRVISIKNKSGEWDLICPDSVAYGKWMDNIALVFRVLHVDPDKVSKMVGSGEETSEDTLRASSSGVAPPSPHSESANANDTGSSTNEHSDSESTSTIESSTDKKSKPAVPEKPAVPTRPVTSSSSSSDSTLKSDSRPEIPTKPKPDIPVRGATTSLVRSPPSPTTPQKTVLPHLGAAATMRTSPRTSNASESPRSVSPNSVHLSGSTGSAPGSGKRGPRPSLPTTVPNIQNLHAAAGASPSSSSPSSPNATLSPTAPGSGRLAGGRTQSVGAGPASNGPSPRSAKISPRPSISTSVHNVDPSKKFIVWMPNGLKHGSIYNGDFTIRSYLEKICRTRESVTPDTFFAKNAEGKVLDLDTPIGTFPGGALHEIWWDTLVPGFTMPSDFSVTTSSASYSGARDSGSSASSNNQNTGNGSNSASAPPQPELNPDGTPMSHRSKIVREIVSTEQSYVSSLMTLKKHFIQPLLELVDPQSQKANGAAGAAAPAPASTGSSDMILSGRSKLLHLGTNVGFPSADVIRSLTPKNFEAILGFNDMFLKELTECKEDEIGQLFKKYHTFLKIYNDYSSDYQASLGVYNKSVRDYPAFSAKLDELRAATGSKLRIEDYIIMPVQRVPRYSLLIADLLRHTPSDHPDYSQLQEVEVKLAEIGSFINESVRKSDGAKRLKELEDKGVAVDRLITPYRFLVREGHVKVTEQKKKENKHFFLFNDIFVQVKDSAMTKGVDLSLPEYVWPLNLIWVVEHELTAEIIGPNGVSMVIKKKKADLTWLRDLNARILSFIQKTDSTVSVLSPKRVGAYTSPSDEQYDGEWLNGLKHGHGKSIAPGSLYEGTWEAGKRSGKGSLTYSNGLRYVGEWKNDLQHGHGSLSSTDTDMIYSGNWALGSPNGQGTMTYYPSGDVYEGDFYSGRCTGQGTLMYANGMKYTGQWLDDQFDGRGNLTTPDGASYEGQFRIGVKTGRGLMVYADGARYDGDWLEGCRQGQGEFVDVDGSVYVGDWLDDRPEGKGTKTWSDKVKYEGQFSRGLRKGAGKLSYPDGSRYDGNWLDDVPNGMGTYISADGSSYVGEWVSGRREGKGVQIYASQAKYDGQWYNDRFHKAGTWVGGPTDVIKSYEGEWLFGRLHNKGFLQFANGDSFRGVFKDGRAHGAGTYTYASGATFTGKWTTGLREGKGTFNPSEKLALHGSFDLSCNVLATASLPIFLPPQQPLLLIYPAIEGLRLTRR